MAQEIELDCAPGQARPNTLLLGVLEGLPIALKEPSLKLFGSWTWEFYDIPAATWKEALPTISARIQHLYHQGAIRYGRWT